MPARVEFRLGSIFDEKCDLLVIPSSAGGTVSPDVATEIRKAGLQFPEVMPWGLVRTFESGNPRYRVVAYAAGVAGQGSSSLLVEEIGRKLGRISRSKEGARISAPLLGVGSGDLTPQESATALIKGFQETAADSAVLMISVRTVQKLSAATENLSPALRNQLRPANDDPNDLPGYEEWLKSLLPSGTDGWRETRTTGMAEIVPHQGAIDLFYEDLLDKSHPGSMTTALSGTTPADASTPEIQVPSSEAWITRREREAAVEGARPRPAASHRTGVFISYSHADAEWLERLQKHLKPLQREGIEVWDDTRLKAGEQWREEIREALAAAKVAVLLISADFLASEFIVTNELPPLLKAAEDGGATILPVIVSPCRFTRMESLSRFQAVNDPEKPLVQLRRANREKVLDQVARAVEDALKR